MQRLTVSSVLFGTILQCFSPMPPARALFAEEGFKCNTRSFPCFRDCCVKGTMFCNKERKVCDHCSRAESLCGNESAVHVQCLLYCHLRSSHGRSEAVPAMIPWAVLAGVAVVLVVVVIVVVGCFFMTRGKPPHQWPLLARKLWRVDLMEEVDQPRSDINLKQPLLRHNPTTGNEDQASSSSSKPSSADLNSLGDMADQFNISPVPPPPDRGDSIIASSVEGSNARSPQTGSSTLAASIDFGGAGEEVLAVVNGSRSSFSERGADGEGTSTATVYKIVAEANGRGDQVRMNRILSEISPTAEDPPFAPCKIAIDTENPTRHYQL